MFGINSHTCLEYDNGDPGGLPVEMITVKSKSGGGQLLSIKQVILHSFGKGFE